MSRQDQAWRQAFARARRTERVTEAEHRAILSAVRTQVSDQVDERAVQSQAGSGIFRPLWLAPAAAGALVLALVVWWAPQPATDPVPEMRFAQMLDERLSEPVRQLASIPETQPLKTELAALESDLRRLRPTLPWSSWLTSESG